MDDAVSREILSGTPPASFVYRDKLVSAFMDIQPINPGHVLVVPNKPVENLNDLDEKTAGHLFVVASRIAEAIRNTDLKCEGVNMFLADGEATGQEVAQPTRRQQTAGPSKGEKNRGAVRVTRLLMFLFLCLGFWSMACDGRRRAHTARPTANLLEAGWSALRDQDPAEAERAFSPVVERRNATDSERAQALFGLGVANSELGDHQEALRMFEQLVEKYSDQPDLVFRALLREADEFKELQRFDRAEIALLRALETAGDDSEASGDTRVMGNPFANRRHFAAFALAEHYYERHRPILALVYVSAAQSSFPYLHFCGNAQRTEILQEVLLESKILEDLHRDGEALGVLIPHLFKMDFNFNLDREISSRTAQLMKQQLRSEELQTEIEESLSSLRKTEVGSWEITLMSRSVSFSPYDLTEERIEVNPGLETVRDYLSDTGFYRELRGKGDSVE